MRRAQILSIVVVFIIAVVIGLLIIIFGGRSILQLINLGDQTSMIQFEQAIQTAIADHNPGSRRIFERQLPGGEFIALCLSDANTLTLKNENLLQTDPLYRIVWNSVKDTKNSGGGSRAYLIPDGSDSFSVSSMEINGGFECFNASGGRVRFGLEGRGNRTLVVRLKG